LPRVSVFDTVQLTIDAAELLVIESFRHAGLERFYRTGSKAGIQPAHATKLGIQLALLNQARRVEDMDVPGWALHPLKGTLDGHWAVKVSGNWRLTFRFDRGNVQVLDYLDYH
jgi:proteic killer suppression protein